MLPVAREPPCFNWGGTASLLSALPQNRLLSDHPALGGMCHAEQFARGNLCHFLPADSVIHDECSLLSPPCDVTHLPGDLERFVQLDASHFAWDPTLVLTMRPVETLILTPCQAKNLRPLWQGFNQQ